ncbi:MAG: translation elongation factor G [Lentisphaerae bacterium GWF2_44_16]|nr:MAG: translation elongation factor G [Lentisphaerae bacterium GWF2_44_16]
MASNLSAQELNTGNIRNIGIIAHIDAGKTTLSERFLYYSGKTHRIGNVDEGNTVMDYLDEERSRGITIVAAAASFPWEHNNTRYLFHLIDTPGHIDFTAEVERSIRVSDGAVVIFSGVEGVEAQSEKVWHQSDIYHVPKIAFINKLDRLGASFTRVLDEIKTKFIGIKAIPFQIPIGIESGFNGLINLIEMNALYFEGEDGSHVVKKDIPSDMLAEASRFRDEMISSIAEFSDKIAELYIEEKEIPHELIRSETRLLLAASKICPVFTGSAKKNIGVQPLLDAVADYLPAPGDKGAYMASNPKDGEKIEVKITDLSFCGLIFKIVAGGSADLLYVRTYSGKLSVNDTLINARTKEKIKIKRMLRLYSKNVDPIEEALPGDIIGITGPQNVRTGDTLCSVNHPVLLEKIYFPEPVISIAIEPKSNKDKDRLEASLNLLCREDPTLRLSKHENTGQQILSGMGELHLEINANRIRSEFNIEARYGAPQVAFKETLKQACMITGIFDKTLAETHYYAEVDFQLDPVSRLETGIEVLSEIKGKSRIPSGWISSAESALDDSLRTGGNWGYSLIYIRGIIKDIRGTPEKTTEASVAGAVLDGLQKAISKGTILLEPLMRLEITAPEDVIGEITGYIQARRAVIHSIQTQYGVKRLSCEVPLAEMFGFSKSLPKLSGGRASFSMEPCGYQEISPSDLQKLTETSRMTLNR